MNNNEDKQSEIKTYTSKECRERISPCVADNMNASGRVDLTGGAKQENG